MLRMLGLGALQLRAGKSYFGNSIVEEANALMQRSVIALPDMQLILAFVASLDDGTVEAFLHNFGGERLHGTAEGETVRAA